MPKHTKKLNKEKLRIAKELGPKVKRLRKEMELTQEELGKKAGVSPEYICLIEGSLRCPSVAIATLIASVLNIKLEDLIT